MRPVGALTDIDMARLMASFEPFEPTPRVAVGVSGGADSMALALLLAAWAEARGGSAVALIVDHGLRAGSAAEARQVAERLAGLGLEHHLLAWHGAKPRSNQQAAARAARYALLSTWCRRQGVLHLATGHHRDDQAETLLLRLGRGSGLDGLAGMPAVRELADVRLLRPLLPVPKARLEATLRERGSAWIEDPGNQNPAYARTRLRRLRPELEARGLTAARLAETAGHLGRARAALERTGASLLAGAVVLDPAGYAWLESEPLVAVGPEAGQRALARVLMAVGGGSYAPRLARLSRLYGRLSTGLGRGATLAGCRILPRRGRLLVAREPAAAATVELGAGARLLWDGRFEVAVARAAGRGEGPLRLGPLGEAGSAGISRSVEAARAGEIPAAARAGLPALSDRQGLLEVPHLGYRRVREDASMLKKCRFVPKSALTGSRFTVA
jgi:tRNA(Ile)-lysidine synthase